MDQRQQHGPGSCVALLEVERRQRRRPDWFNIGTGGPQRSPFSVSFRTSRAGSLDGHHQDRRADHRANGRPVATKPVLSGGTTTVRGVITDAAERYCPAKAVERTRGTRRPLTGRAPRRADRREWRSCVSAKTVSAATSAQRNVFRGITSRSHLHRQRDRNRKSGRRQLRRRMLPHGGYANQGFQSYRRERASTNTRAETWSPAIQTPPPSSGRRNGTLFRGNFIGTDRPV